EDPATARGAPGVSVWGGLVRGAGGEPLGFTQAGVSFRGHAIEVRVCAEDPAAGFLPSAGPILLARHPAAPGVRVDTGIETGARVPVEYDPLLAKVSVWDADRERAVRRMQAALRDVVILGPTTNVAFLQDILAHPAFAAGATHTGLIEEHLAEWHASANEVDAAAVAAALAGALRSGAPGVSAPSARPSAWDTLGRWRLGV